MTNLIYEMNAQLQQAQVIDAALRICAEFSASVTDADGSFVCLLPCRTNELFQITVSRNDVRLCPDHLLNADHPFYQQVITGKGRWQQQDLTVQMQHRFGLDKVSASAVLAIPIENARGTTSGAYLVWKSRPGAYFIVSNWEGQNPRL
jgi:hypothetical protein